MSRPSLVEAELLRSRYTFGARPTLKENAGGLIDFPPLRLRCTSGLSPRAPHLQGLTEPPVYDILLSKACKAS